MIKVTQLSKSFGSQVLFNKINLQMNPGERVGFVGRNGHGKTTLFHIILETDYPDEGSITFPKNYKIGHLDQHIHFTKDTLVTEAACGLSKEREGNLWEVEKILAGLGFSQADLTRPPTEFSGGFQVRINLAKALIAEPDLLLLDEPTNYLDIISIRWLSDFLKKWKGELILITHDRSFMDNVCTHTMVINRQQIRKVKGPTYKLFEQIRVEEEVHENTRVNEDKKRKQEEKFINKFRAKARMAGMVQSRIKALDKKVQLEKLSTVQNLNFNFRPAPFEAKTMLAVHNLSFSYDKNLPNLIEGFNLDIHKQERLAIIGQNGKGKSTLLKLLARSITPQTGSYKAHISLKIGYYEQTNVKLLDPERTVAEEIANADPDRDMRKARDVCGAMMFDGDKALKKIKILSGGEKSRVCLGKLLVEPNHLLLLDEPTNHLDPESCDALMSAILQFKGSVVLITHNEGFLKSIPNKLIVFQNNEHKTFEGGYLTFLREVGWQAELDKKNNPSTHTDINSATPTNKKDLRRLRAQKVDEKNKALKPIKSGIRKTENSIQKLEDEINDISIELTTAYETNDGEVITKLSKATHDLKNQSDQLYQTLEEWMTKEEAIESQYQD